MTLPRSVTVESPAKVNLGLEILGRRPDGYHEIRTVMAQVSLCDTMHVGAGRASIPPNPPLDGVERNLVDIALARFREHLPVAPDVSWSLEKRIPVAAGLGGASSNAATALVAANQLAGDPIGATSLAAIAGSIGSDVPFFLGAPVALASGRGVDLQPLPAAPIELLLVVPDLRVPAKTATLYSLLSPSDFGDGSIVAETALRLANSTVLERSHLRNAFCRALATLDPRIGKLQGVLEGLDVTWALSGAGPTHYVVLGACGHDALIGELRAAFGNWLAFHSVRTAASPGID